MGKLIDADLLLENATKYNIGRKSFEEMIKCVKEQPTAYDVETVVRQLKQNHVDIIDDYTEEYEDVVFLEEAIDIVRKGGVK